MRRGVGPRDAETRTMSDLWLALPHHRLWRAIRGVSGWTPLDACPRVRRRSVSTCSRRVRNLRRRRTAGENRDRRIRKSVFNSTNPTLLSSAGLHQCRTRRPSADLVFHAFYFRASRLAVREGVPVPRKGRVLPRGQAAAFAAKARKAASFRPSDLNRSRARRLLVRRFAPGITPQAARARSAAWTLLEVARGSTEAREASVCSRGGPADCAALALALGGLGRLAVSLGSLGQLGRTPATSAGAGSAVPDRRAGEPRGARRVAPPRRR